jgi:hypothetical protein
MTTYRAEPWMVNKDIGLAVFGRKDLRRMCRGVEVN